MLNDVCFIDIKILYFCMFGKYPPFNQCRQTYLKLSEKLLNAFYLLRQLLVKLVSGDENEQLVQLAWHY